MTIVQFMEHLFFNYLDWGWKSTCNSFT